MSFSRPLRYAGAVAAGLLPSFFVVFNAIFSDVFSVSERLFTFVLTLIVYGILGAVFGYVSPRNYWGWAFWLTLPAAAIVIWYSLDEGRWLLHLSYVVVAFASAAAGAAAGSNRRIRNRTASG